MRRERPQSLPPPQRRFPATVAGMSDDDEWTPGDVTSMIANPFYAINIDDGLAVPHEPLISEDNWVEANVRLIEELGDGRVYLRLAHRAVQRDPGRAMPSAS